MAKQKNKKILLIASLVAAVLLVIGLLEWSNKIDLLPFWEQTTQEAQNPEDAEVNYSPPTDEEKQAGNNVPAKQGNSNPVDNNTGQKWASVAISDASKYDSTIEVRAFVTNVIADGTCTYTFTSNGNTVTKTSPAKADVSTTNCLTLEFPASELASSSTWKLTVSYNSADTQYAGSTDTELRL